MVHFDVIWSDVLEVGTAEKISKAIILTGAFWHYLKWCFYFSILLLSLLSSFMPDPSTSIFWLRFSHLKVIKKKILSIQSLLERVNEYALLRACTMYGFLYIEAVVIKLHDSQSAK